MGSEAEICALALGGRSDFTHEGILGRGGSAYVHKVFPHLPIAHGIDLLLED
jgi:hypothetical protein